MIILVVNFLLIVIINDYGFGMTILLFLVLGVLLVDGRKDLRKLSKKILISTRKKSRDNNILSIYDSLVYSACLISTIALPLLVHTNFVSDGIITNILGHYIGWIFAGFTPWIFESLRDIIIEFI